MEYRYINLGGGANWNMPGWLNLDIALGFDLNNGLGSISSKSVDIIYTSHCLEHLELSAVYHLLLECHRVLTNNGLILSVNMDCLGKIFV